MPYTGSKLRTGGFPKVRSERQILITIAIKKWSRGLLYKLVAA
jgi:hypothetical protein